jgi:hypothetical protein
VAENEDFRAYQTAQQAGPVLLVVGGFLLLGCICSVGFAWWMWPISLAVVTGGIYFLQRAKQLKPP